MKKIFFILLLIFPTNINSIVYDFEPRYISLKKDKTFARHNASFDAGIKYIYQKKNLPVLITNEHGAWRKILDIDNHWGWVHTSMISNKKTFINKKEQNLFKYKDNTNVIIATVKKNVVGKIVNCYEKFCKVKVGSYKGWVEKKNLWGIKEN